MEEKPEWSIFERQEELEKIALELLEKIKAIEGKVTVETIFPLVWVNLIYSFVAFTKHYPQEARKIKDDLLSRLRNMGLQEDLVGMVEKRLISLVDALEKEETG